MCTLCYAIVLECSPCTRGHPYIYVFVLTRIIRETGLIVCVHSVCGSCVDRSISVYYL